MKRKDFFKNACLAGGCLCGFASMSGTGTKTSTASEQESPDPNTALMHHWVGSLLDNMNSSLSEDEKRQLLKSSSSVHYEHLKMDELLAPYIGKMDSFIQFLQDEWGWRVEFDKAKGELIANENKSFCVCPIINSSDNYNKSAICYCSEGFAEKMFSRVATQSVSAKVLASVNRGDEQCIYQIRIIN